MKKERIKRLKDERRFEGIRKKGKIKEMEIEVKEGGYIRDEGKKMRKFLKKKGVMMRKIGNVIYVMKKYWVKEEEIERKYEVIKKGVDMIEGKKRWRYVKEGWKG